MDTLWRFYKTGGNVPPVSTPYIDWLWRDTGNGLCWYGAEKLDDGHPQGPAAASLPAAERNL